MGHLGPTARSLAYLGAIQIRIAWDVRGGGLANSVDENAWGTFHELLQEAEETLRQATLLDPQSSDPFAPLLTSALGLSLDDEQVRRRFERVQTLDPFRPDVCTAMLQRVCKKWSGSHEEMFTFARWVDQNAPAGSPAHSSLPMAHIERLLLDDEIDWGDYLESDEVKSELVGACERYLAAIPSDPGPMHLEPLNLYLFCIGATTPRAASVMKECIRRLAERPTRTPWFYFNDSIAAGFVENLQGRQTEMARFTAQPGPSI